MSATIRSNISINSRNNKILWKRLECFFRNAQGTCEKSIHRSTNMMSDVEIRILKKDEYGKWDGFVNKSHHGTIFHNSDWLGTCSEVLNKDFKIHGFFDEEELIGGCAFFIERVKGLLIGSSFCEMTPYFGLIWEGATETKLRKEEMLFREFMNSFQKQVEQQLDRTYIINPPGFMDVRPFAQNGYRTEIKYTYYLKTKNITKSKGTQKIINGARKKGIYIEKSDEIQEYSKLLEKTLLRKRIQFPRSKDLMLRLYNKFHDKKQAELWIARTKDGEVAAGEIILNDPKMVNRWSAATNIELGNTGANALLLDTAFLEYDMKGYETINLMCANVPSLTQFVSGFNPILVPYFSLERNNKKYEIAKQSSDIFKKTTNGIKGIFMNFC